MAISVKWVSVAELVGVGKGCFKETRESKPPHTWTEMANLPTRQGFLKVTFF